MAVGAPIEVPISDGAVVVFKRSGVDAGSFKFAYEINGELYPWWEQQFLGQDQWVYYLGLSGYVLFFVSFCCFPCLAIGGPVAAVLVLAPLLILLLLSLLVVCSPCICCCLCISCIRRRKKPSVENGEEAKMVRPARANTRRQTIKEAPKSSNL